MNDYLFYGQGQNEGLSGLEKLLYSIQTPMQDWMMRLSWGDQGQRMPRPQYTPEAQDLWKEMLERQMWNYINQGPKRDAMGSVRQQPMNWNLIGRRG